MDRRTPSPTTPASYHHTSPLETLLRRASSKRVKKNKEVSNLALPPSTPPRQSGASQQEWTSPVSPLLHTQFRSSTATSVSAYTEGNGYADSARSSMWDDQRRPSSSTSTAMRGQSIASEYDLDDITASYRDSYRPGDSAGQSSPGEIPTVVVSSVEPEQISPTHGGRMPSRLPPGHKLANFSRPVPPVIDGTEERKRQVLMRNNRMPSPLASTPSFPATEPSRDRPPSPNLAPSPSPSQQSHSAPPSQAYFQSPHAPPSRSTSPSASVYSTYSYYPYDNQNPSPTTPTAPTSQLAPPTATSHPPPRSPTPTSHTSPAKPEAPPNPQTPQEYLQLGIQHHLANRLEESAECFEKSATLNGGCGVGMLMWGLALRHGWGCEKSEMKGFKWLRKAAEIAVADLESARQGMDTTAVRSELVLAIYEVGQSFFRGWGVEKDKQMGVSYFRVAAGLGDPDAQQELAFCLANGKGCKKDRKEAAKWYRAAVAQGASDIGLAWIYKEKFQ